MGLILSECWLLAVEANVVVTCRIQLLLKRSREMVCWVVIMSIWVVGLKLQK